MDRDNRGSPPLRLVPASGAGDRTPRRSAPPMHPGSSCGPLLNILNGKIQVLIDQVRQLEERLDEMEVARAAQPGEPVPGGVIIAGPVKVDHDARQVFVKGREVPLSPTEYRLIHQLAVNSGKVVLHRDLLRRASVHGDVNPGHLKVYIGRLRAKLQSAGGESCDLSSVRGVGYRLSA